MGIPNKIFVTSIIGPIDITIDRVLWYPITNDKALFQESRSRRENFYAIVNRIINKSFLKDDQIVFYKVHYGKSGIAFIKNPNLKEKDEFIDARTKLSIVIGRPRRIDAWELKAEDFKNMLNRFLDMNLKRRCKIFSVNEYYFDRYNLFTHNDLTIDVNCGFEYQILQDSQQKSRLYLLLLNRYRPMILPTLDKIAKLESFKNIRIKSSSYINATELFLRELKNCPLNVIKEYAMRFNKLPFAGYLFRIIRHTDKDYNSKMEKIMSYYKEEGEEIFDFIQKKISDNPKQPIVEVKQKGKDIVDYLSSILILTPSTQMITYILDLLFDKDISVKISRQTHDLFSPTVEKYLETIDKWRSLIRQIMNDEKPLWIRGHFDFIKMEGK